MLNMKNVWETWGLLYQVVAIVLQIDIVNVPIKEYLLFLWTEI